MTRLLFGPVSPAMPTIFAPPAPDVLLFDCEGRQPLSLKAGESWDDLLKRLPTDWQPEILVLWLQTLRIPHKLWQAPIPIVAIASGWESRWSVYRRILPNCDLVLADEAGAAIMQRAGITQAHAMNLAGLDESVLADPAPDSESPWTEILAIIERERASLTERANRRAASPPRRDPVAALWTALSGGGEEELIAAMKEWPESAERALAGGLFAPGFDEAADAFDRALDFEPTHPVAGLNRAAALALAGRREEAVIPARQALYHLERTNGFNTAHVDSPPYFAADDPFRADWEHASWEHAGDPEAEASAKRNLVRCRLHALLADLTGDLVHFQEAVHARPDLASTRAALGCALARSKRFAEALPHLHAAVDADPFDRQAARAMFQVLSDAGDLAGRAAFAQAQKLLHATSPERVPMEDWFNAPPLSGKELTSIIVLACDQLEFTRMCLESLLKHTRGDYELILVDNGSSDGTAEYFEEVRERSKPVAPRPEIKDRSRSDRLTCDQLTMEEQDRSRSDPTTGPARVEIIRNETNKGFAAGVNQGLAAAQGEYLVLLNNDTLLTPGWLEGLIGWSLHDWPKVGLVGPTTNYAPPPQLVEPGYTDLSGLDGFARKRRRQFAGQALEVPRVTGFCLLLRRAVLEAMGGKLDERFGIGFFEDDDLCQLARQAGFKLLVASNVYIHHFGSRTFSGLGVNTDELLRDNFQIFRAKWGDAAVAPYRVPENSAQPAPVPTPASAGRVKVSLCIITKNEEKNLADCIGPMLDVVDEIVVLDTGSTDRTKELARSLGARVFESPWQDSFAAARNAAIEHANGDWIFWMDADDRVDVANQAKLKQLFAGLDDANRAFVMKCLCVASAPGETATVVDHVRLFRNDPRHRWSWRVHEQILPSIRATQGEVQWSDVVILHTGYTDPVLRRKKLDRDLRLLNLEHKERPDEPFTLFNIGSIHHELNQPREALPVLRRSLELSHPNDSIVRKLHALIAQSHRGLGQIDEALATCINGRKHYPNDAELLFMQSVLLREKKDLNGAEELLRQLIGGREEEHFSSIDTGLRGYKARHNLAVIYLEMGRLSEAEAQWRAALLEEPAFFPAQTGLGEVLLRRKEWAKVDMHAEAMSELGPRGEEEASILSGLSRMNQGEFAAARGRFQMAVHRFPKSLRLRQLLADAYLGEGSDDVGAENALNAVLALDPENARARQNLHVLRQKRK